MLTLGERIKYVRTNILRQNQAAFARALGFSRIATISDYEKNKRCPDIKTLTRLASLGGVKLDWLLTGKGPVSMHATGETPLVTDTRKGSRVEFVNIEVYDLSATKGPEEFPGTRRAGCMLIPKKDFRKGALALHFTGESMSPSIMDGATVGVDRNDRDLVNGELYAVWLKGEGATVKRVFVDDGRVVFRSDNPAFPDTSIPAASLSKKQVLGRVIWLYQKF